MVERDEVIHVGHLKPNSYASRKEATTEPANSVEKPRVKTIATTKARVNPWRKFSRALFVDDRETVAEYVIKDVFFPTVREFIFSAVSGALEMALWGAVRGGGRRGGFHSGGANRPNERTSYSSYYANSGYYSQRPYQEDKSQKLDWRDFNFYETSAQAEDVLAELQDAIAEFGHVRLADFYQAVGRSNYSDFTDEKWGWFDLSGANVRRVRGGYIIDFPKLIPLTQ